LKSENGPSRCALLKSGLHANKVTLEYAGLGLQDVTSPDFREGWAGVTASTTQSRRI